MPWCISAEANQSTSAEVNSMFLRKDRGRCKGVDVAMEQWRMRMLGGAPRLKLAFEFINNNLLAALVGGFVAELCKEGAMP